MADLVAGRWSLWELLPKMSLRVATHQILGWMNHVGEKPSPWKCIRWASKIQMGWQGAADGKGSLQRGLCSQKLLCQGRGWRNVV